MIKKDTVTLNDLRMASLYEARNLLSTNTLSDITDFRTAVGKARDLWHNRDIVSLVGELMVSAASGFEITCRDKKTKNIFDDWAANINQGLPDCTQKGFDKILEWMFREYWQSGFVLPYLSWGTKDGVFLPLKGTIFDPLTIKQEGSSVFGGIKYSFEESLEETVGEGTSYDSFDLVPGKESGGHFPLRKSDTFYILKRGAQPYELFPHPYLTRIFKWIDFRDKLLDMDYATASGVLASIVLFKILSGKPEERSRLATILKTIKRTSIVATSADIKSEVVSPPVESLLSWDKFREADLVIRESLGLVEFVGVDLNSSRARFNPIPLVAEIQRGRREMARLMESIFQDIVIKNNLSEVPNVHWKRIRLFENEQIWKLLVRDLYDRGILSLQTYAEEAELEYEQELERRKAERPAENVMTPRVTFKQSISRPEGEKVVDVHPGAGRPEGTEQPVEMKEKADYTGESYHHIENPDVAETGDFVATIRLKNGVLGRLIRLGGLTAIKVYLFPKDRYTYEEAKQWVGAH